MSDTILTDEDLAHLSTIGWSSEQEKQAFAEARQRWLERLSRDKYLLGRYLENNEESLRKMATLDAMGCLGRYIQ